MKSYGNKMSDNKREIEKNLPPHVSNAEFVFSGKNVNGQYDELYISNEILDKNLLVLGEIGSGKTNVIAEFTRMIIARLKRHEKIIILDVKGDYSRMLRKMHIPAIYFGIHEDENCWNIFEDLWAFGDELSSAELRAEEIAPCFFKGQKSEKTPYFVNAASGLFSILLKYMLRQAYATGDYSKTNNAGLRDMLDTLDYNGWLEIINSYKDFAFAGSFLNCGDGSNTDSSGVLSEIAIMKEKIFTEAFAEVGGFSLTKFAYGNQGGIVVLKSDLSLEEKTNPVFAAVLDNAIKAAAAPQANTHGLTFILDEFGRLPHMDKIEMGFSLLRDKHIHFILGIQTVEQMQRQNIPEINYKVLLDLILNVIILRCGAATVEHIQHTLGTRQVYITYTAADGSSKTELKFRPVIETEDVINLEKGGAFVKIACDTNYAIFRFHFDRYP